MPAARGDRGRGDRRAVVGAVAPGGLGRGEAGVPVRAVMRERGRGSGIGSDLEWGSQKIGRKKAEGGMPRSGRKGSELDWGSLCVSLIWSVVMRELEAINIMRGIVGMDPVNSIVDDESKWAQSVLSEKREELLEDGWVFNTDEVDLIQTSGGEVLIPDGWLRVRLPEPFVVRGDDGGVVRKVYDPERLTFVVGRDFPGTEVVKDLSIEEVPQDVARAIAYEAAHAFCVRTRGHGSVQTQGARLDADRLLAGLSFAYPSRTVIGYGKSSTLRSASYDVQDFLRWISAR